MQGSTEQHQLKLITQLCGAITPAAWPGVEKLELYNRMEWPREARRRVKDRLRPYVKDQGACDLIDKLLLLDPAQRPDADAALMHDFFWTDPMPCKLSDVLKTGSTSMPAVMGITEFAGNLYQIFTFVKS